MKIAHQKTTRSVNTVLGVAALSSVLLLCVSTVYYQHLMHQGRVKDLLAASSTVTAILQPGNSQTFPAPTLGAKSDADIRIAKDAMLGRALGGSVTVLAASSGFGVATHEVLPKKSVFSRAVLLGALGESGALEHGQGLILYVPMPNQPGTTLLLKVHGNPTARQLLPIFVLGFGALLVVIWGLTARLLTQQTLTSLRNSHEHTRAIVETAVDGIVTIDSQGVILTFNQSAQRMFGYEATEVIGRNVSVLMTGTHAERHDHYLSHYLKTGQASIIGIGRELVAKHATGKLIPIELALSEMTVGTQRGFTGVIRDITERKRAERESENLNLILKKLHGIGLSQDSPWTEKVRSLLGLGAEHFCVKLGILYRYEGHDWVAVQATGELDNNHDVDGFALNPAQAEIFAATGASIHWSSDDEGAVHGFSCGGERVEAFSHLAVALEIDEQPGCLIFIGDRSERTNTFGTTDLEIAKLIGQRISSEFAIARERVKVQRADKLSSIGVLAAGVAHEVNNPLAGVIAGVEALHEGMVAKTSRDLYFRTIREGLERIRQTIRGLLDYSRRAPVMPGWVELHAVARASIQLVRPAATKKSIQFADEIDENSGRVWADRTQLMQATVNVILNAVAASPQEGTIFVSATTGTGRFGIRIRDEGPGIPPDLHEKALTPFFTTRPPGEGTGLGLPITQALLAANFGELEIGVNDPRGGTFTLWLPSAAPDGSAHPAVEEA